MHSPASTVSLAGARGPFRAPLQNDHEETKQDGGQPEATGKDRGQTTHAAQRSHGRVAGLPSLDDWVAYIVTGTKAKRRVLSEHASERKVKGLLYRIHSMSKKEVEKLAKSCPLHGTPALERTPR